MKLNNTVVLILILLVLMQIWSTQNSIVPRLSTRIDHLEEYIAKRQAWAVRKELEQMFYTPKDDPKLKEMH